MRAFLLYPSIFCELAVSLATADAQWSVQSSQAEKSSGGRVEHRHVEMTSAAGGDVTIDAAVFSAKTATLRVIDEPKHDADVAEVMTREKCLAGVNGGYFDPQYAPVGLLIADARVVAPQQKARLLSGVVSVANGRVQIQRAAELSLKSKPSAARQCGPFLVENGSAIAGLDDARGARRTFVAVMGGERAAIGSCSDVTLAQLGALLATPGVLNEGKVQRALNLDGGSSSGFWFAGENGAFSIAEWKHVRDYLAVVPK